MVLPNFLGIGAPRAGTTWLNTLLPSHPDVYTPTVRDEINFFDRYYKRGLDWYERLFPSQEDSLRYQAIGEISPQYLECEECPERIFRTLPESKLIVMLRHPVNRAYSQYGMFVQRWNYKGSFEDFISDMPRSLQRGFYSRYLKQYLQFFDRTRILTLVFEDAVVDIPETKKKLADFLGISVDRFPSSAGHEKVNPSSIPRFQFLYGFIAETGRRFRKWHLEPIVDLVMRTKIPRIMSRGKSLPQIDEELKKRLSLSYKEEFDELEQCMKIDLSCWM